jgi:hypothetical protein
MKASLDCRKGQGNNRRVQQDQKSSKTGHDQCHHLVGATDFAHDLLHLLQKQERGRKPPVRFSLDHSFHQEQEAWRRSCSTYGTPRWSKTHRTLNTYMQGVWSRTRSLSKMHDEGLFWQLVSCHGLLGPPTNFTSALAPKTRQRASGEQRWVWLETIGDWSLSDNSSPELEVL